MQIAAKPRVEDQNATVSGDSAQDALSTETICKTLLKNKPNTPLPAECNPYVVIKVGDNPAPESVPTKEQIASCDDLQKSGKPPTEECNTITQKVESMIVGASASWGNRGRLPLRGRWFLRGWMGFQKLIDDY